MVTDGRTRIQAKHELVLLSLVPAVHSQHNCRHQSCLSQPLRKYKKRLSTRAYLCACIQSEGRKAGLTTLKNHSSSAITGRADKSNLAKHCKAEYCTAKLYISLLCCDVVSYLILQLLSALFQAPMLSQQLGMLRVSANPSQGVCHADTCRVNLHHAPKKARGFFPPPFCNMIQGS